MTSMDSTTTRGAVHTEMVSQPGGTVRNTERRSWRRDLRGVPHSFTAILMPNGERRYFVDRYNGYCADAEGHPTANALKFGCAWSPLTSWTIKPTDPATSTTKGRAYRVRLLGAMPPRTLDYVAVIGPDPHYSPHPDRRAAREAWDLACALADAPRPRRSLAQDTADRASRASRADRYRIGSDTTAGPDSDTRHREGQEPAPAMDTREALVLAVAALTETGDPDDQLAAHRLREVLAQCGMDVFESGTDQLPEFIDVMIDG